MSDARQRRLEKIADKNVGINAILAVFLPPLSYAYLGMWGWALINALTLNYLLLGVLLVPWHTGTKIRTAREEVTAIYETESGDGTAGSPA